MATLETQNSASNGDVAVPTPMRGYFRVARVMQVRKPLIPMKPELKKLIEGKRNSSEPLLSEEKARGFKGWYASKNLPHFDSQGAQQFITFRLQDSFPAERRSEWEA